MGTRTLGVHLIVLPESNSSHLPGCAIPKRKLYNLPSIHFQGRVVSFREGTFEDFPQKTYMVDVSEIMAVFSVEMAKHILFATLPISTQTLPTMLIHQQLGVVNPNSKSYFISKKKWGTEKYIVQAFHPFERIVIEEY